MTINQKERSGRAQRPLRLAVEFNAPKIPGRGEDADPLLRIADTAITLGVFDGLGGSGAMRCDGADGVQTSAYYGARVARSSADAFLQLAAQFADVTPDALAAVLVQHLQHDLAAYDDAWGRSTGSALRSTVFRRLPTTAAIMVARPTAGAVRAAVLWAGDSRCYALSPEHGLQQLTRDQLRTPVDALANLTTDSSISNCISADAPFTMESAECTLAAPCILLAVTDGCFGYIPTPMHFEALLLASLLAARSCDGWRDRLRERIVAIAGDDASLAGIAVGWSNYRALRRTFAERLRVLKQTYLAPLDADSTRRDALWRTYRAGYEALQPKELPCMTA
jgi:Protein phosphatase 2C